MRIEDTHQLAVECWSLLSTVSRHVPRQKLAFPEACVVGRTTAVSRQLLETGGIKPGLLSFDHTSV